MQELSSLRRRLGGRPNLADYAGRAAPCPERKLKSATTCFRAGSYLPAAGPMPATAVRSQISKATIMTLARPMFPRVDPTRRHFLLQGAGAAAGATALALATVSPGSATTAPTGSLDPVLSLIEAHRTAHTAHYAALKQRTRLERVGDPLADTIADAPCHADSATFFDLIEAVPTTLAGVHASLVYLDDLAQRETWMFEEDVCVTLISNLAEALGNLVVVQS